MTHSVRVFGVGALATAIIAATTVAAVIVPGAGSGERLGTIAQPPVQTVTVDAGSANGGTPAQRPVQVDSVTALPTTFVAAQPAPAPAPDSRLVSVGTSASRVVAQHGFSLCAPMATGGPGVGCASTAPANAPLTGRLYVDPTSRAAWEAARLQAAGQTAEASLIRVIAEQPQAVWINGNETGAALVASLSAHRSRAEAAGQRLVFVTYAIPFRDCGSYSAGGLTTEQYGAWNTTIADTLRGSEAIMIVEPDALPGVTSPACASVAQSRPALLKQAVVTLAAAGLNVYIDAGHSNWVNDATMANLLTQAGVASARGFATNVSNYRTTASEVEWAQRVSARLGGKRFVIDTSRNGNGPNDEWCNPLGRALGANPTLDHRDGALDALLWIKRPGESDGPCNGGPSPGQWWHDYAIGLVQQR